MLTKEQIERVLAAEVIASVGEDEMRVIWGEKQLKRVAAQRQHGEVNVMFVDLSVAEEVLALKQMS